MLGGDLLWKLTISTYCNCLGITILCLRLISTLSGTQALTQIVAFEEWSVTRHGYWKGSEAIERNRSAYGPTNRQNVWRNLTVV
ncbi:hypothetical protein DMR_03140 [Solidesulfovibrio magneticus RS-1]|uniref:Uncharacterized protein n=1 Tax=Solidesulfovibrio magneticus (strain ATCC 700980 / DSM 13731 / RS-1) TaxID=573370 RepID=C4XGM5_SOLM1|nr:hypothetical protein DMR_03140 [Solidesulfovibrio magneticus RS-1]